MCSERIANVHSLGHSNVALSGALPIYNVYTKRELNAGPRKRPAQWLVIESLLILLTAGKDGVRLRAEARVRCDK